MKSWKNRVTSSQRVDVLTHFDNLDEFYLFFEQKSEFWPIFRDSRFAFSCLHETLYTNCYVCRLHENRWFSWSELSLRVKIATISWRHSDLDIRPCIDFCFKSVPNNFTFRTWRTFWLENSIIFGKLASAATLFAKFHVGTKNHYLTFGHSYSNS